MIHSEWPSDGTKLVYGHIRREQHTQTHLHTLHRGCKNRDRQHEACEPKVSSLQRLGLPLMAPSSLATPTNGSATADSTTITTKIVVIHGACSEDSARHAATIASSRAASFPSIQIHVRGMRLPVAGLDKRCFMFYPSFPGDTPQKRTIRQPIPDNFRSLYCFEMSGKYARLGINR